MALLRFAAPRSRQPCRRTGHDCEASCARSGYRTGLARPWREAAAGNGDEVRVVWATPAGRSLARAGSLPRAPRSRHECRESPFGADVMAAGTSSRVGINRAVAGGHAYTTKVGFGRSDLCMHDRERVQPRRGGVIGRGHEHQSRRRVASGKLVRSPGRSLRHRAQVLPQSGERRRFARAALHTIGRQPAEVPGAVAPFGHESTAPSARRMPARRRAAALPSPFRRLRQSAERYGVGQTLRARARRASVRPNSWADSALGRWLQNRDRSFSVSGTC